MNTKAIRGGLAAMLFLTPVMAQSGATKVDAGKQDKDKAALRAKLEKQFMAALAKEKIVLDRKKKTVTIPCVVNRPENDLEYLLIHPVGKKHEALLVTESKPSVLRAALMAMGAKQGKNASFKKKDPFPTEEELKKGVDPYILVPPSGGEIYMTVAFSLKGKKFEWPIEELLLDWTANLTVASNSWVHIGGRLAQMYRGEPPVFMADYEGNLISVCYKHPPNHLITLVHERAQDEMNWAVSRKCPPPGTELKLTFHVNKPKVVAAREAQIKKRKGQKVDLSTRPERNPATEGGGRRPPAKADKKETDKKGTGEKKKASGKAGKN